MLKIFDTEKYNGITFSFHETCGFAPYDFEYKIIVYCDKNEYKIIIHPEDSTLHEEIKKDLSINYKYIDIDYSYFDYIFKKLKNINFDIFIYNNSDIDDDGLVIFNIKKNKYSLEVCYHLLTLNQMKCSKHIHELNSIFEEIKRKIDFKQWYSDIKKRYNIGSFKNIE